MVLTSEDVPGRGQSSSGTQPLKGSELTIQLGLRNVTISYHEDWKHQCETLSTLRLRYMSSAWDSHPESPDQSDLLGIFLRYVVTNRIILSYSFLSYLGAPIIVMGVQQAPGLGKQRPKNYSYE